MRIGIIGAGYVGRSLACAAIRAGHNVMLSNSRGPQSLFSERGVIGCMVGTVYEAAEFGEIIVVAIPVKHYQAVPADLTAGKIVVDTNNYYPDRDVEMQELQSGKITSSELMARHLPESKIVKAFNAILMPHFDRDGEPTGARDRRALPLCGDDPQAKKVVADLHDQFGFDYVDVGPLAEGWRFQPGTPVHCVRFNKEWIQRALAEARQHATQSPIQKICRRLLTLSPLALRTIYFVLSTHFILST